MLLLETKNIKAVYSSQPLLQPSLDFPPPGGTAEENFEKELLDKIEKEIEDE